MYSIGKKTPRSEEENASTALLLATRTVPRIIPARIAITLPCLPRIDTALVKRVIPILELNCGSGDGDDAVIGSELIWDSRGLRIALRRSLHYELQTIRRQHAQEDPFSPPKTRADDPAVLENICEKLADIIESEKCKILQAKYFDADSDVAAQASPLRSYFGRKTGLIPPTQTNETIVAWDSGEITFLHDKMGIEQEEYFRNLLSRSIAPMSAPYQQLYTNHNHNSELQHRHHPLLNSAKLEATNIARCQLNRLHSHVTQQQQPMASSSSSFFSSNATPSSDFDTALILASPTPMEMWSTLMSTQCNRVQKCTWTKTNYGTVSNQHNNTSCGGAITHHDLKEFSGLYTFLASFVPPTISNAMLGTSRTASLKDMQYFKTAASGREELALWVDCAKDIADISNKLRVLLNIGGNEGTQIPPLHDDEKEDREEQENENKTESNLQKKHIKVCLHTLGCLRYEVGRIDNYFDRKTLCLGATVVSALIHDIRRFVQSGLDFDFSRTNISQWDNTYAMRTSTIIRHCLEKVVNPRICELQLTTTAALTAFSAEKARIMIEFFKNAHSNGDYKSSGGSSGNSLSPSASMNEKKGVLKTPSIDRSLLWVFSEPILPNLITGCQIVGLVRHNASTTHHHHYHHSLSSSCKHQPIHKIVNMESDLLSQFGWEYLVRRVMEQYSNSGSNAYPGFKELLRKALKFPLYDSVVGSNNNKSHVAEKNEDEEENGASADTVDDNGSVIDSVRRGPNGELIVDSSMWLPPFRYEKSASFTVAELFYVAALGHRSASEADKQEQIHKLDQHRGKRFPATQTPLTPQEEQTILKTMNSQLLSSSSTTNHSSGGGSSSTNNSNGGGGGGGGSIGVAALGHLLSAIITTQRFVHREGRTMDHSELTKLIRKDQVRNQNYGLDA